MLEDEVSLERVFFRIERLEAEFVPIKAAHVRHSPQPPDERVHGHIHLSCGSHRMYTYDSYFLAWWRLIQAEEEIARVEVSPTMTSPWVYPQRTGFAMDSMHRMPSDRQVLSGEVLFHVQGRAEVGRKSCSPSGFTMTRTRYP